MARYLGNMGESDFARLCAAGGLVCNKSNQDAAGWDFIVEFPFQLNTAPLADKVDPPIECKVQVKATDGASKKVQIEMSNLMRLCKYSHPAFIFFFEYDKEENPQRAYLVHISKEVMFKVLRRSREISVSDERKKFNKATMSITYGESDRLPEISSAALIAGVKRHIPTTLQQYVTEKIKNMDNLGYEDGQGVLKFSTPTPESLNDFVDALLGIKKHVNVVNVFGFDCRFGINVPDESMSSESAIIQFLDVKSTTTGELKFHNVKESKSLRFTCEIFTPPVAANLPKKYIKVRAKCDLFDVIINVSSGKFEFNFRDEDELCDLYRIRDAVLLMEWLWKKDSEIDISITRHDTDATSSFSGLTGHDLVGDDFLDNVKLQLDTLNGAVSIAQRLGLESHIKTKPDHLFRQYKDIKTISSLLRDDFQDASVGFKITGAVSKEINKVSCLIVLSCFLGDFRINCISTFEGDASRADSGYLLNKADVKVHEFFECRRTENRTIQVQKMIDSIADRYKGEDITVVDFFSQQRT